MRRFLPLSLLVLLACQPPAPTDENMSDVDTGGVDGGQNHDAGGEVAPDSDTADAESDAPAGCADDEACPDGTICEGSACIPGCRFDGACPDGEICEDSLCSPGCRNPADCPPGQTCRAGVCVAEGCVADTECAGDARCVDGGCVQIGAGECESDDDCGHRWRCSTTGQCFQGQCLAHADCEPDQWCREQLCVDRRDHLGAVRFERVYPEHLASHVHHENAFYGVGGGLMNFDGDGDIDLFLGSWIEGRDSPPCVYRNVSEPGEWAFEPVEDLCGFHLGRVVAAAGVDVDADGRDEIVFLGDGIIRLQHVEPDRRAVDLMELLPEDDHRRACQAGACAATDLDLDGRVDLLIGCQSFHKPDFSNEDNLAFRQREDGEFELFDRPAYQGMYNNGVTVALGVLDINDDGLLDLLIVNDGFVPEGQGESYLTSGEALFRNPPGSDMEFTALPFGEGIARGGSYMGVGNVRVDGLGEHLYLTDYGPNRLINYREGDPLNRAVDLGIGLGYREGTLIYAWSALVDDFDRNGLDDILVTQGVALAERHEYYGLHQDTLLLQRSGGDFSHRGQNVGLDPPLNEDSDSPRGPFASRGGAKADLDGDGMLDVVIGGLQGFFKFYAEQPTADNAPDRCSLVPRPRVVPAYGFGYAVAAEGTQQWVRRDMQGHLRFGASPWVLSTANRGQFRFPSGAEVPFDCRGGAGPILVREPNWIEIEAQADVGRAVVTLDSPWLDDGLDTTVRAAVRDAEGAVREVEAVREEGAWVVEIGAPDRALMLQVRGRWVARWFVL